MSWSCPLAQAKRRNLNNMTTCLNSLHTVKISYSLAIGPASKLNWLWELGYGYRHINIIMYVYTYIQGWFAIIFCSLIKILAKKNVFFFSITCYMVIYASVYLFCCCVIWHDGDDDDHDDDDDDMYKKWRLLGYIGCSSHSPSICMPVFFSLLGIGFITTTMMIMMWCWRWWWWSWCWNACSNLICVPRHRQISKYVVRSLVPVL